jgi:hypothetical protein
MFYEGVGASNQNVRPNALQFAKMHEVTISVSLSAMILNYIQHELLVGKGVPLSSLLAPFQVNNLASLWRPGFWATTGGADGMKLRRFLLLCHRCSFDPSGFDCWLSICHSNGAISWFLELPDRPETVSVLFISKRFGTFGMIGSRLPGYYMMADESTIWPKSLSNITMYQPDCNSTANPTPTYCPLGGYSTLLDLFPSSYNNGFAFWNFTIQS